MNLSALKRIRVKKCLDAASSRQWFSAAKHAQRAAQLDKAMQIAKEIKSRKATG